MTTVREKIFTVADEVMDILRELSRDNRKQLNTELIAERMYIKDTVKKLFTEPGLPAGNSLVKDGNRVKRLAESTIDLFSHNVPSSIADKLNILKQQFMECADVTSDHIEWLDSIIRTIKGYLDSLSSSNHDMQSFIKQTMNYLEEIEKHLIGELSSYQEMFRMGRDFESRLSVSIDGIKKDFTSPGTNTAEGIEKMKTAVLRKIENINAAIEKKREQDLQRIRKTEETIREMSKKMSKIVQEAARIKKKAEQLEKESHTDKLTGLNNRSSYDAKISETIANLARYGVRSSLMICDIDHFKKINDTYGHKVGDLALKKLASLMRKKMRINDFIARYGGEEFAVILPHTPLQEAQTAAEALRHYIHHSTFSYRNNKIPLTISIGISEFRRDDDPASVFERADSALYMAKTSGRNNVKTEAEAGAVKDQAGGKP